MARKAPWSFRALFEPIVLLAAFGRILIAAVIEDLLRR
jgi:hypothetical protein